MPSRAGRSLKESRRFFRVFDVPNWVIRSIVILIISGLPIACVLAWTFELTPRGIKPTAAADAMWATGHKKKRGARQPCGQTNCLCGSKNSGRDAHAHAKTDSITKSACRCLDPIRLAPSRRSNRLWRATFDEAVSYSVIRAPVPARACGHRSYRCSRTKNRLSCGQQQAEA
jgi:hypothetical protein